MRNTPYKFLLPKETAATAPPKLIKKSFDESLVVDLSKEFSRPKEKPEQEQPTPTPGTGQPETTTAATPGTETTAEPAENSSAKLRETVGEYKNKIETELKTAIENPKRAAATTLKFLNLIRLVAYPFLYKKILFDGPEAAAFDATAKKIAEAKIAGKEPVLNAFEKDLWAKMEFFKTQKLNIPWTEEEINEGAEIAYMKLAEIKFLSWLMENEWAIYFLVLEGRRFGPVIGNRMGLGEIKL